MSFKREELLHITATATIVAALMGTVAPANMRRYIYKVHTNNQFAGVNILSLNRGSALVIGALIDEVGHVLIRDQYVDPDELKVNSAPLYILEAAEGLWLTTSAGNMQVTCWYVDAP